MIKISNRIGRVAVALGVAAVVAAGCGSGTAGTSDATSSGSSDEAVTTESLVETLRSNGLTSLATAVETLEISELADGSTFTFFAPNDDAFQSLDADDAADLLADPTALAQVLRNHLVTERMMVSDLGDNIVTSAGNDLSVERDGETTALGGATIVQGDIVVGDGVVHVIDRIILP